MLNSKSRIVLSSLSALGLIGAGVAAHHVDADLFNNASDVKTPTVKAESKQIDESKKSDVQSVTTYSAPAATIVSTIGSDVISNIETETDTVSDNDNQVEQTVGQINSESDVETEVELNIETTSEQSVVADSETNTEQYAQTIAPVSEPVVEQISDTHSDSIQSETKTQDSHVNEIKEPVFETTENTSVTEVTTESLPETSVVETPKVSEPVVEAPVVHEEVKPSVVSVSYDQSNTYPVGQCTWGVKSVAPWVGNYWGNANQWGESARRAGFRTGYTPQVGSVIVFPNSIYEGVNYGHVGYVTAVNADGTIEMVESNYRGNMYVSNYRGAFTPSSDVYYIYPNN